MAVSAMRLTPSELAAWVPASCARQGLPVKVTDAGVVKAVAMLLQTGAEAGHARRRAPTGAPLLQAPDNVGTVGIEASAAMNARVDDRMIEHGRNNGDLS